MHRLKQGLTILGLAVAAGCGSAESREGAAVTAAASGTATASGENLYRLPAMRRARAHRETGAHVLERAYATKDEIQREGAFNMAMEEFRVAEEAYQEALTSAPPRFRPVIDNEMQQVAQYMRQIQRDRAPPRVD